MSLSQDFPRFCLFCYKITTFTVTSNDNLQSTVKFFRFMFRFASDRFCGENTLLVEQQINKLTSLSKLVYCCEDCERIIDEFCEVYHQIKCLELQLDFSLNKLLGIVQLSNRIPTRWTNVNKILQRAFQKYPGKISESQDIMSLIRQRIINSSHQTSSNTFPRVSLAKNSNWNSGIIYESSIPEAYPESQAEMTVEEDLPIDIKFDYPHLPTFVDANVITTEEPEASPSSQLNALHGFGYSSCKICQRRLVAHRQKTHYEACHDLSKVSPGSQAFRCKFGSCSAYFLTGRQLKDHRTLEHNKTTTANKQITGIPNQSARNNVKSFSKTNWDCVKCGKNFYQKCIFRKHVMLQICQKQQTRATKTEQIFHCKKCSQKFTQSGFLRRHMKSHTNNKKESFMCSICGVMFAHRVNLTRHFKDKHRNINGETSNQNIRIDNTSDIPKVRLGVQIKIERNSKLSPVSPTAAVRKIIGTRKCSDCGKSWKNIRLLWCHRQNVHLKHVCLVCGNEMVDKHSLELHLKRYHKNMQRNEWECKECGKKVNREYKLKLHMRVHTGEKPFSCHVCQELFAHRQSIRRHLRRSHGLTNVDLEETSLRREKKTNVSCKFCGRKYTHPWKLLKHLKIKHQNENLETTEITGEVDEETDGVDNAADTILPSTETNDSFGDPLEILPHDECDVASENDPELAQPHPPWIIDDVE